MTAPKRPDNKPPRKPAGTLFGLPWVSLHSGDAGPGSSPAVFAFGEAPLGIVAIGTSPRGIIAIGLMAQGIIAIGPIAVGVLAALGSVCLGGGLALGGVAAGFVAMGGVAVGGVAIGGVAIGYYTMGGALIGLHTLNQSGFQPGLLRDLTQWLGIVFP
jgi:hypothetical protein